MLTLMITLLTTVSLNAEAIDWLSTNVLHQYNTYGSPVMADMSSDTVRKPASFKPVRLQRPSLLSPMVLHQYSTYGSAIMAQPVAERTPASVKADAPKNKKAAKKR